MAPSVEYNLGNESSESTTSQHVIPPHPSGGRNTAFARPLLLVFIRQVGYIIAVPRWSFTLVVLGLLVTTPWPREAQSQCDEERELIGLSLEPLSAQGLSVTTLEPLGFAARSGIQVGDVIEQVNNQLLQNCRSYQRAVQEAKKDKKALLLLVNTKKGKQAIAFERAIWQEPEKKAAEAVASLKTLLETSLPPAVQSQVHPLGDEAVNALRELESAVPSPRALYMPGSLRQYEQKLQQTQEQISALRNSAQGEAGQRVLAGVQVILGHYQAAQEIWQYKAKRIELTKPDLRKGEQAIYSASLPYFFDSPVLVWVDRYPFLKPTIVSAPYEKRFGEEPGEWKPDEALRLLWREAKEETDKLTSWLQKTARSE